MISKSNNESKGEQSYKSCDCILAIVPADYSGMVAEEEG